ncbi:hypothetical protein MNBD_GAMMA20-1438 [hydrothermal vent metagenome]|uniref:Uncharacterized protein n=1 Tax=hydrothermal vent metagenome TaxID=652676 RepID=A0A3B1AZY3_9ZZZZ
MTLPIAAIREKFFASVLVMAFGFVLAADAEAMGMKSIFEGAPTEDQCRQCHGDNAELPHPKLQVPNPDRHHARVGTPIMGLANGSHDTVAPGDVSTGVYHCLTCHSVYNSETQQVEVFYTTDCMECHTEQSVTGNPMRGSNVHHFTDTFYSHNCSSCHNFLSSGGSGGSWGGMGGMGGGGGMRGGRGMRGR